MSNEPRIIQGGVSASANDAKAGNRPGPLVEDMSVAGGTDRNTGAPVIRPKATDGKGDNLNETTDSRERR